MTPGSAGLDLLAGESAMVGAGDWAKVSCGFSIAIPIGFEGQVRPRSGLALEYGVTVLNAPGTIDADYRGLVQVILINHGTRNYQVERGARIAQLVISPVLHVQLKTAESLEETERAQGGFGHTGR
ncbi:MAG: dUTP diphosphatase [Coprothermobacterota bacterium]|nr:dUTP diphosphatase [Coprothermobacterota bacterium]